VHKVIAAASFILMFKNSLLRGRILRSKIEALKEGWRKLHSGELHDCTGQM